jgi:hypothetical protein
LLIGKIRDADRKRVLDGLGRAGSTYRQSLYRHGLSGREKMMTGQTLTDFLETALAWVDHSIAANRRPDDLYHAYNLARFEDPKTVPIRRLYEMLEGQVAALSSGQLGPEQGARLLDALRRSAMFRTDQHSYVLYPNRELPRFGERNNLSARAVSRSPLLKALSKANDRSVIERDRRGQYHFAGALTSTRDIVLALESLAARGYARLVERERAAIVQCFERLFDHESFTGRSGTFFAYEGLGSIYWHMVSKLLLAVQEVCLHAMDQGVPVAVRRRLERAYHDIRAGLGDRKPPEVYGAFPMDPYSHTPAHMGARQPGLTGQVKEDILCHFGELGVQVVGGCVSFRPRLLRSQEFLKTPSTFDYVDVVGVWRRLPLPARSLAFTFCQVPIHYRLADRNRIVVARSDGTTVAMDGSSLDAATSCSLLDRAGEIRRITVLVESGAVCP